MTHFTVAVLHRPNQSVDARMANQSNDECRHI